MPQRLRAPRSCSAKTSVTSEASVRPALTPLRPDGAQRVVEADIGLDYRIVSSLPAINHCGL